MKNTGKINCQKTKIKKTNQKLDYLWMTKSNYYYS